MQLIQNSSQLCGIVCSAAIVRQNIQNLTSMRKQTNAKFEIQGAKPAKMNDSRKLSESSVTSLIFHIIYLSPSFQYLFSGFHAS